MSLYQFKEWEDGTKNPKRIMNVAKDMSITATYKKMTETGTVTFSGSVSVQEKAGETVTITVKKPDATTQKVTTLTEIDLTYTVDYTAAKGPGYSAKARIEEGAEYQAAESEEKPFSIGKKPRTITLNVS